MTTIEDASSSDDFVRKLASGIGAFFPGYGPGEPHHEERWLIWCYRYDYKSKALEWTRIRTGFPESLAPAVLEAITARWPTLPDSLDRPPSSGRPADSQLGVPWPVYRVQKVTEPDPSDVPGVIL